MPLLIRIIVFCHLQQNSTLLDYRLSELHTTHWAQMGHAADVPGSSQRAHKEEQHRALKEAKEQRMAITSSPLQSS